MNFIETALPGVVIVAPDLKGDERGFFARTWCAEEFAMHGLAARVAQCNLSYNRTRGTVRGLHYQAPPAAEDKLVRVVRGAIFDVAVDLRPDSPTFLQWVGVELTADNRQALYVPKGCAHGFQTLTDDAELFYQMSEFYAPALACGVRWDDPLFAIAWPLPVQVISERDANYPDCTLGSFDALRSNLLSPTLEEGDR